MPTRIATSLPYTELVVAGPYDGHTGNFDKSRAVIDRIIIHTMDGTWQGAAARFANSASNVSAHYGVKEDGTLIHWLEEYWTAYHAGDYGMNQRSIGIEHEDLGNYNGVRPDVLYSESAKLVADICKFYSIPCDRDHIRKHNEVSDRPTGCPDGLDIERIVREAQAILTPPVVPAPPPIVVAPPVVPVTPPVPVLEPVLPSIPQPVTASSSPVTVIPVTPPQPQAPVTVVLPTLPSNPVPLPEFPEMPTKIIVQTPSPLSSFFHWLISLFKRLV